MEATELEDYTVPELFKHLDDFLLEYEKKQLVILLVNSMLNDYSSMLKDKI